MGGSCDFGCVFGKFSVFAFEKWVWKADTGFPFGQNISLSPAENGLSGKWGEIPGFGVS